MGAPTRGGSRGQARPQSDDVYLAEMMRVSAQRRQRIYSGTAPSPSQRANLKTVAPSGTREQNPERRAFFAEGKAHQAFMKKEEGLQREHFNAQRAFLEKEAKMQEVSRLNRQIKKATGSKKKELTKMLEALQRRAG